MNKAELIAAARAQWPKTEAMVSEAVKGNFDAKPAEGWSARTYVCHLIDTVHRTAQAIDAILHDQPLTMLKMGDEEGAQKFIKLAPQTMPIELNTAHGIMWMALQKVSDADLEKELDLGQMKMTVGQLLEVLCIKHGETHANDALKAAGRVATAS